MLADLSGETGDTTATGSGVIPQDLSILILPKSRQPKESFTFSLS